MPFHPWDWIAHITMSEHKNVEDVEEDAKNADYHRKVNVNCVVEVLPIFQYQCWRVVENNKCKKLFEV